LPIAEAKQEKAMTNVEMMEKIQTVVDDMINPALAMHGGFVELVDVENGVVSMRMSGGCQGCGAAQMTMAQGIENLLRDEIPEVEKVVDVTDHAAGESPFYASSH
jgi:Fe/S biogenesis protein NfuA